MLPDLRRNAALPRPPTGAETWRIYHNFDATRSARQTCMTIA
jgi:hypothetical protein